MKWSLALTSTALVLAAGYAVPRRTVTDGLDRYEGRERVLAEEALTTSYYAIDKPLLSGTIIALRVVAVEPEGPGDCDDPAFAEGGAYPGHKAEVVGYTLFRTPVVRVHVTCGGATYRID